MALSPEGEVGHFECSLRWVQVHHPHNPPEKVTGSIQHGASEQRYPSCVADEEEGYISLEVEVVHWGQDNHRDRSLDQFEPGHGSEELNVGQGVNHSVLLRRKIRIPNQSCDFRNKGSMEAPLDGCMTC